MSVLAALGIGVAASVIAAMIAAVVGWVWRRGKPPAATAHQVVEVQRMLGELQQAVLAPPLGTAPVNTKALASAATRRAEQLLTEAVELQRQHKEREAIECLLTAYDRELPAEAKTQLHILAGNGFLNLSELEEAEGHYRQALAAAQQAKDPRGQAAALGGLGNVYSCRGQPGDLDKAEQHHKKALRISTEIGNHLGQAIVLGNLGLVYAQRGELEKAKEHFKKAQAIHQQIGNRLGQAQQLGNLGLLQAQRGNAPLALDYITRARELFAQVGARAELEKTIANIKAVQSASPPQPKPKPKRGREKTPPKP